MRMMKMLLLSGAFVTGVVGSAAAEIKVVASVKPIHSLVAAVMEGVGRPDLIVEGAGSPHTYSMKPSQAQMLQDADVVFWVGETLEAFLEKPLDNVAGDAKKISLLEADGLERLKFREGGAFEAHSHDDHEGHDDKVEKAEADHDHDHQEAKAEAGHDHDHDHDHDHAGGFDPHVWLDPANAAVMVDQIAGVLAAEDRQNEAKYLANADLVKARIETLTGEIRAQLAPVADAGFIVFHDAYQYFEKRFDLTASGSITISPDVVPGAQRVSEIREQIGKAGVACVFSEPQFEPKIVEVVLEGTDARAGVLDPLGAALPDGPDLYFSLMAEMANAFQNCLGKAS